MRRPRVVTRLGVSPAAAEGEVSWCFGVEGGKEGRCGGRSVCVGEGARDLQGWSSGRVPYRRCEVSWIGIGSTIPRRWSWRGFCGADMVVIGCWWLMMSEVEIG